MAEYTPSSLTYTVEKRPGGTIIALDGELGLPPHTDRLQTELVRIYRERPAVLIFDLSKLTFCSSLGIGIFADAKRRVTSHSGQLKLCCAQPRVMEVFERTRMNKVFDFISNIGDAFSPAK
jgi:anti-anti-sigma factor